MSPATDRSSVVPGTHEPARKRWTGMWGIWEDFSTPRGFRWGNLILFYGVLLEAFCSMLPSFFTLFWYVAWRVLCCGGVGVFYRRVIMC